MQSQYYFYFNFLNRLTANHRVATVIHRLQDFTNLRKFPKPLGRMTLYLEKSSKCFANIQKTAEDLKMKLLRSSVPSELFNRELNSIVDQCRMLSDDSEKEIGEITKGTTTQQTQLRGNEIHNEVLDIGDNFFEDPFDYVEKPDKSKPENALEKAIERCEAKTKNSRKRTSICLSEAVSTAGENKSQRSMNYSEDKDGWVTAFIDGSCLSNGKGNARAGLGVWFSANSTLNLSEPVKGRLTNNVGEIEAAIRAIEQAHSVGISKLVLKTDSMFLINCIMKWRLTWEKNGWKTSTKKPVINRAEIQKLTKTMDKTKVAVRWEHVKAHSNIVGNEAADFLAKQGAEKCHLREFFH